MKEVTLPSGAVLKIQLAPFEDSKALFQMVLEELEGIEIEATTIMAGVYKNLFCVGFSSKKVEAAIWKCFERCLYNDVKVGKDTFEPESARDDYMTACMEVTDANVRPFVKSLSVKYGPLIKSVLGAQA